METTPVAKAHAPNAPVEPAGRAQRGGAEAVAPAGPASETAAVEIRISEAGEKAAEASRPGKADQSPAHQARAFLAERADAESAEGEKVPFGQIVSRIARGIDPEEAFAAPAEDVAEGEEASAEDEDAGAAEEAGSAPAPTAQAGDNATDALVAEVLDDLSESDEQTS